MLTTSLIYLPGETISFCSFIYSRISLLIWILGELTNFDFLLSTIMISTLQTADGTRRQSVFLTDYNNRSDVCIDQRGEKKYCDNHICTPICDHHMNCQPKVSSSILFQLHCDKILPFS